MPAEFWADCAGVSEISALRWEQSDHLDSQPAAQEDNKELRQGTESRTIIRTRTGFQSIYRIDMLRLVFSESSSCGLSLVISKVSGKANGTFQAHELMQLLFLHFYTPRRSARFCSIKPDPVASVLENTLASGRYSIIECPRLPRSRSPALCSVQQELLLLCIGLRPLRKPQCMRESCETCRIRKKSASDRLILKCNDS